MLVLVVLSAPARAQSSRGQVCRAAHRAQCVVAGDHRFRTISAGVAHTCAIARDASAWCWGDGRSGALGDGSFAIQWRPVRVRGAIRFADVRAGDGYTCGLSTQGDVFCWGRGYPIPGYPETASTPVRVPLADRATALAAGRRHTCVVGESGSAWCWGRNVDGETGIGTSGIAASITPVPTRVLSAEPLAAIAAGLDFTCAATRDGAVYCWGSNVDGVLGADAPERCGDVAPLPCASRPQAVPLAGRVEELSAGYGHVCARTAPGEVWCWGANAAGQVGGGAPGPVSVPQHVAVPGAGAASVSAGGVHSCAQTVRAGIHCWGGAAEGLSSAEPLSAAVPADLGSRRAYVAVTVGGAHICALGRSGAARCWGDNRAGALGAR